VDVDESDLEGSDVSAEEQVKPQSRTTKVDKMFNKKNLTILSDHYAKLKHDEEEDNESASDDDLLTIKRADHDVDDLPELKVPDQPLSHRQVLKAKTKELKERGLGKKFSFDEDGKPLLAYRMESLDQFAKEKPLDTRLEEYVSKQTSTMKEADALDKKVQKERVRERKLEKKRKERAARQEASGSAAGVSLGPSASGEDYVSGGDYESDAGSAASFSQVDSGKRNYSSDDASESDEDAPAGKKVRLDDLDKKRLEDMAHALLNPS
jgi:ATP-dependent RNA helicase DDX10/DBP4